MYFAEGVSVSAFIADFFLLGEPRREQGLTKVKNKKDTPILFEHGLKAFTTPALQHGAAAIRNFTVSLHMLYPLQVPFPLLERLSTLNPLFSELPLTFQAFPDYTAVSLIWASTLSF